jgi:hypothetical protein
MESWSRWLQREVVNMAKKEAKKAAPKKAAFINPLTGKELVDEENRLDYSSSPDYPGKRIYSGKGGTHYYLDDDNKVCKC